MEKRGKNTGRASRSGVRSPVRRVVRLIPKEPGSPRGGRAGADLRLKVRPLATVARTDLAGSSGHPAKVSGEKPGRCSR